MFYILEGQFEITCGGETFVAPTGSLAILPKGIPHGFRNIGTASGRIPETIIPAGFERYFEELSELPPDQPPDMEVIKAMARKYDLGYLPPTA